MNIIEYIFIDVIIVLLGMYFYKKYDGRVIYSIIIYFLTVCFLVLGPYLISRIGG